MNFRILPSTLVIAIVFTSGLAWAADQIPLEITADKALEWDQKAKTYTAKGNALAKQDTMSVKADTLTAFYDDSKGGTNNITKLVADGHVTLISGTDTATGEKAVYDLTTGEAVLSGTRPKITRANGDMVEADNITAWMEKSELGSASTLQKAEATGNVIITNGKQTAAGDRSVYTVKTNMAELFGNVKISQDKNWLTGDYADMNLTTHISHVTSKDSKKQVKGVFYTTSKTKVAPKPTVTETTPPQAEAKPAEEKGKRHE